MEKILVEVAPWVSPLCLVQEKKQFGIWVFLEVQEINCIFVYELFSFYEVVPLLTMRTFFRNILAHGTPV